MQKLTVVNHEGKVLGTADYDGITLRSDHPGIQDILTSRIRNTGGHTAAWRSLRNWSNGYLSFLTDDKLPAGGAGGQELQPERAPERPGRAAGPGSPRNGAKPKAKAEAGKQAR